MEASAYLEFKKQLALVNHLQVVEGLLGWDQNVNVPSGGHDARADLVGDIAGLEHKLATSKQFEDVLMRAVELARAGRLQDDETVIVERALSDFDESKKLTVEFVAELAQLCAEAHEVWVEARTKSDFKLFEPHLTRIVQAKRQEAEYLGYQASPYDALMDCFEPGFTSASADEIFRELKPFLVQLIDKIKNSNVKIDDRFLSKKYPIAQQSAFARMVVEKIGFDFSRGRMDVSIHPFCQSMHSTDVRLTTRFDEKDFINQALFSLIHEAGQGMYEQGLSEEYFGTPLGESVSMGIHESQSRMWENQVGRSLSFWRYFYPDLKRAFTRQLSGVSLENFYRAINAVKPGFVRVDADEVTYNLHVILRFEIERALIEGDLEVSELPYFWNQKIREYLGLIVPNDSQGVLQDIHWSGGLFGYFPTYTLGNLYSAQILSAALRQMPKLDDKIVHGDFTDLRDWLKSNIHVHGRRYLPEELILRVTGDKSMPVYLIDYLDRKYSEIYNL